MQNLQIIPLANRHTEDFVRFTDEQIGAGYYTHERAQQAIELSQVGSTSSSLVLIDSTTQRILGIRVSFPPGRWIPLIGRDRLHIAKWSTPEHQVAYFKSLFIDSSLQGLGYGPIMSAQSLKILKSLGAKAVVTHSWSESPQNSSIRYLQKFGFQIVGDHPGFWSKIDYLCTGCNVKPCRCTATEMLLRCDEAEKSYYENL